MLLAPPQPPNLRLFSARPLPERGQAPRATGWGRGSGQTTANKSSTQLEEALKTVSGRRDPAEDVSVGTTGTSGGGRGWLLFTGFPFPLGPLFSRQTVRYEAVPGTIWTFEQEQSFAFTNVSTTVRMTAIRLKKSGGLLLYAPIAPTRECLRLLRELGLPVEHILLTTHAYEHKIFIAPFQRNFPSARVWTVPELWSWPLNLPLPLLGIFNSTELPISDPPRGQGRPLWGLRREPPQLPWSDELEHLVLAESIGKLPFLPSAPYSELAMFHKASGTLLVTDAVVHIPSEPPEVINRAKLRRAGKDNIFVRTLYGKDRARIPATDDEQLRIGWARMALLVSYFSPEHLRDPFTFSALADKLIVMPVILALVFTKIPGPVSRWVDEITSRWRFKRIISCHFKGPVSATPAEFRRAFQFAYDMRALSEEEVSSRSTPLFSSWIGRINELPEAAKRSTVRFPEGDLRALQTLDFLVRKLGVGFSRPVQ